jgi:DNA mismatch repair protein MSH4
VTPSIGLAFVNVTIGEATLSQINDNQMYVKTTNKLQIMAPSQILLQTSECPPAEPGAIYGLIQEMMADTCNIIPIDRRYWSEKDGLDHIRNLAFEDEAKAIQVAIHGKFYATCAFAAVSERLVDPSVDSSSIF